AGRKDPKVSARGSLRSKKAKWVVKTLLDSPEEKWSVQLLAQKSGISAGTCHRILTILIKESFIKKEDGGGFRLMPEKLNELRKRIE
ncbi:MAG: hypothetical protein ABH845_06150, partial [Candidatus Omnitrophota bacterium]